MNADERNPAPGPVTLEPGRFGLARGRAALSAWDEQAFAAAFAQHYPRLVGVLTRLLGERALAEEIASEALWKLYRQPGLQAEGNNIPGWLHRTATRLGLDALRSRRRWRASLERAAAEPAPPAGSAHAEFEQRERATRVRRVLARLKPAHAQILMLRHSGLSYLEIAAAMRMKASSVGATLARAEAAFENAFRKEETR